DTRWRAIIFTPRSSPTLKSSSTNSCIYAPADCSPRQANNGNRSEWAHNMTVLVTGGAGYIGSHMVHVLLEAGKQVVVLDNLTTGFDWAVPAGATLIVGDAGDHRAWARSSPRIGSTPLSISQPRSSCQTRSAIRSATTATTRSTPAP